MSSARFTIGINSSAYIEYDLLTAFDHIAEVGFQYVEIAAIDGALEHLRQEDLTPSRANWVRSELERRGLAANALAVHTNLTADNAVEKMLPRIKFAADIGAPVCVTGCGPRDAVDRLKPHLDILVKAAEEHQVVIALETNADIIRTGKEGLILTDSYHSPWLGVNYDAANVYRGNGGEIDILQDFRYVVNQLKHVHIKDLISEDGEWRFCLPGAGVIDMQGFLKILCTRPLAIGVNLEMPFQYRFSSLSAPIRAVKGDLTLKEIDHAMKETLALMTKALI